ncbi:cation efflux family-domain-containing protein [Lipomyces orientalis]|uniref:Cation efflux family-domain-containing protein n=1 Tax=Lipomyces orientalis TaxID=1233043 RepID=A0ACC3TP11_9ASCO
MLQHTQSSALPLGRHTARLLWSNSRQLHARWAATHALLRSKATHVDDANRISLRQEFHSGRSQLNSPSSHKHDHNKDVKHDHSHTNADHSHSHSIFHSHSHTHDSSLLLSDDVTDPGVRITRIGLWVNLGMAVAKGIGGYVFNSKALIADAAHALSDLLSDFLTLGTVSVALKRPTAAFPKGFGKVEALGSLGVSAMLMIAGLGIGVNAAESVYSHIFTADEIIATIQTAEHAHEGILHSLLGHSHSHGAHDQPDLNAAWLAGGSILIKEWLFQATMKIAQDKKSTVLAANAWHHRVDCLTSIVALVAITGSHFWHLDWLDPAGGLLVSTVILQAGYASGKQAVLEIVDHSMPDDILDQARAAVANVTMQDNPLCHVEILDLRGVKSGPVMSVDVDLRISPKDGNTVTLEEANRIAKQIKLAVANGVKGVRAVSIRTFDEHETDTGTWIESNEAK